MNQAQGLRPPLAERLRQLVRDPAQPGGVAGHAIGLVPLRLLAPAVGQLTERREVH